MKLTDTKCKAAKGKDKPYKMADGAGLYLLVNPDGGKYWRMKYYFQGVNKDTGEPKRIEKLLSFGAYPLITLSEAREMRDEAKKRLAKGIDPATEKKQQKRQAYRNAKNSFKAIAEEWYDNQKQRWSDNHYNTVKRRLEKDVFPEIGNMPINSIEPPDLLDALRKIEKRGALDVAGRVKQICGQVFRYGIQTGRCTRNPTSDLQGALKIRKTEHFAALDIKEIPEFLHALENNEARLFPRTRRAIKLSMLTFVRPSELRQAQWDEIDLEAKEWIIPAEKMKMRRAHIVPLSRQAIAILEEQKKETGYLNTPYVFPSLIKPKQCISDGTVNVAIKKLGFTGRMTAHGFRALARTAIREKLDYEPDVIECQLAHRAAGALGEAYNRAQFLDKRKTMMQEWADYLDAVAKKGKVVHGNFGKAA